MKTFFITSFILMSCLVGFAQPTTFIGKIGNQSMTFYLSFSTNSVEGYCYAGNGENKFIRLSGGKTKQGGGLKYQIEVKDLYLKKVATIEASRQNGVMKGTWTNLDDKQSYTFELKAQKPFRSLAKQQAYKRFKQKFCRTKLPLGGKQPCTPNRLEATEQEMTLFFADFSPYFTPPTKGVQHQGYGDFGYYQTTFTLLEHVQHPYESRFDILIVLGYQKEGGSTYSPWVSNTFVVTYDKYGNYISSVLLHKHWKGVMPPTVEDMKKENPAYKTYQGEFGGTFNQRLQIVMKAHSDLMEGKVKQQVYQILANGYIVLL